MASSKSGDFYDPSLAWAEAEEEYGGQEEEKEEEEKQRGSSNGISPSIQSNASSPTVAVASLSMAKILRMRRDEARKMASRGNVSNNDDDEDDFLTGDEDVSDGKWF